MILLLILMVIVSIALILVILAQSSKGGALEGMVGGAASDMFGGQGASNFLTKATKILVALFFILCFLMAFFSTGAARGTKTSTKAVDALRKQTAKEQPVQTEDLQELPKTEEAPATVPATVPATEEAPKEATTK